MENLRIQVTRPRLLQQRVSSCTGGGDLLLSCAASLGWQAASDVPACLTALLGPGDAARSGHLRSECWVSEWPEQLRVSTKLGPVSWAQPQAHVVFDTVPLGLALQMYLCRHTVWLPTGRKLILGDCRYNTVVSFYHFFGRVCGICKTRRVQPTCINLGVC